MRHPECGPLGLDMSMLCAIGAIQIATAVSAVFVAASPGMACADVLFAGMVASVGLVLFS